MIELKIQRSKKLRLLTKLQEAYDRANGSYVTVGVHSDAGAYPAETGKDPPTVAEVANWLEYGTKRMPPRSFMQSTIDENKAMLTRLMDRSLINIGWNHWTVERALARVGSQWLRAVQNKIKSNVGPELGHSKGSARYLAWKLAHDMQARTLIATGKLLGSMAYKISLSGAAESEARGARAAAAAGHSDSRTGNAKTRAAGRQDGEAFKARQRAQRAAGLHSDPAKAARFAAQQATKQSGGSAHKAADKPHGKVK